MSEQNDKNEELKKGLDRIEEIEVSELSKDDLESIAGGSGETTSSTWCCSAEQTVDS